MKLLGERRMDFLKSLLLVILIPLVVSTLSFASKNGATEELLKGIVEKQGTILTEVNKTQTQVNTISKIQSVDSAELARQGAEQKIQGELLNVVDKEVVRVKTNVENIKANMIMGGAERLNRIEDLVFGK